MSPPLRIGDAERDAAVTELGEHYAAGRLTKDEFDERSGRAWSARFDSDVRRLFDDLPQRVARRRTPSSDSGPCPPFRLLWLVPIVLLAIAVVAATRGLALPLLAIGGIWLLATGRHRRRAWQPHESMRRYG